ncbi:right-handed parallel beta-helix repeat-containing protein [Micromonospora rhizosphaerae]|uniref:right-handed parallel beta-helix repeat-containing protein n=1 Tax=Micromonospora rhizosphaerae TaxID=568872 RepID=UPI00159F16E6|nr:NosD domain-containing protein [Micromonospora rhizosphaerae]
MAVALVALSSAAVASLPSTLVVDRDGAQCGNADFTSIQAAVDAAEPGTRIKVCPDVYPESVRVDKPLILWGEPDAVEAIDCFDAAASQADGLDPTQQVIVDPAADGFSVAFDMLADDVVLAGFVVQDASVGIDADDRFSGQHVHHNLVRLNTLFGMDFGTAGARESRVDHNCFRDNRWGLVCELDDDSLWKLPVGNERGAWNARDLRTARIDHNDTFRNQAGIDVAGPGRREQVTVDHNVSRAEGTGIALQNSARSAVIANEVVGASGTGSIAFGGGNTDLTVASNLVTGGRVGIIFASASYFDKFPPSRRVTITGNTARGMVFSGINAGQGLTVGAGELRDSVIAGNVSSDNGLDGIIVPAGNAGNDVRDNVTERNGRRGIYAASSTSDNTFSGNWMFGNGVLDARDDNRTANTWVGNQCLTDYPEGTICGAQSS